MKTSTEPYTSLAYKKARDRKDYNAQASLFLNDTKVSFEAVFLKHAKHFVKDYSKRDIYTITLKRGDREMAIVFGQSIADEGKAPGPYDVLACLTKCDCGTFEDFCGEFGYDEDSRTAETTYKSVCKEYADVQRIWADKEIEILAQIS